MMITVVTVVYNGAAHLEQTILSVLGQRYQDIEYIVIDGGSTDGTVDIIRAYEDRLAHWVSEQDGGIGDAMNKGIAAANGDYLLFLHADDYLLDDHCIADAVKEIQPGVRLAAFPIVFQHHGQHIDRKSRPFGWGLNFKTSLCHQGVLCDRTLFEEIGGYDKSYRIAMDYEFWMRAYRKGIAAQICDRPLSLMRDTGISAREDWDSLRERFREERRVHFQYARDWAQRLVYHAYWLLYLPYRRVCAIFSRD